jgi:mannosyl-oligosaccharide alpha-1,2-mannosidase
MVCIDSVTVGAFADSAYEYLLKQWLLSGRTDTKARDLCMTSSPFPYYSSS